MPVKHQREILEAQQQVIQKAKEWVLAGGQGVSVELGLAFTVARLMTLEKEANEDEADA